jgi:hypothetical protein
MQSRCRPGEGRDPYAVSSRCGNVVNAFVQQRHQGLWVPAFAGTTRGKARLLIAGMAHIMALQ